MSEWLSINYTLEKPLGSMEIETLFRHCFEDLGCSRTSPNSDDTDQFRYTTEKTEELVTGAPLETAISDLASAESGAIWLWYDDLVAGIHINASAQDHPALPFVSLTIDEWYLRPWNNDRPELIHEFVRELYDFLAPIYVHGDTYLDSSTITREGILKGQLEDLFWVNGFGPEMAEQIGRERLLNAPAWQIDDCDDGGVFLWESPLPLSPEKQDIDARLRAYFGVNVDTAD